ALMCSYCRSRFWLDPRGILRTSRCCHWHRFVPWDAHLPGRTQPMRAAGLRWRRRSVPAMRILSWNLWWRYGPWEQRRKGIEATLAEVSPDVCGFQEVWEAPGQNLAGGLAEGLGMRWCFSAATKVRHVDGVDMSTGNAILSRWPITEHAEIALP